VVESNEPPWDDDPRGLEAETRSREEGAVEKVEEEEDVEDMRERRLDRAEEEERARGRGGREEVGLGGEGSSRASETMSSPDRTTDPKRSRLVRGGPCLGLDPPDPDPVPFAGDDPDPPLLPPAPSPETSSSPPTPKSEVKNLFPLCKASGLNNPPPGPPSPPPPRRDAAEEVGMDPVGRLELVEEGEGRPEADRETMDDHFFLREASSESF